MRAFFRTHPGLDALLAKWPNTEEWAYITAWNPESELLSDQEKRICQRHLKAELHDAGYTVFPGHGIPRQHAIGLGVLFGQNAIVYGRSGESAELV